MKNHFKLVLALLLSLPLNPGVTLAQSAPQGDGVLRLYNYHLNEFAEIRFRQGPNPNPEGLRQVQQLLRSRDNQQTITLELRLLDLIDFLQDHFGADTIEIISGYRSKEFNESLLKTGHKVSPVSLHMEGKALDIHIDEIREETLRDYAVSLGLGGVGYYGPLDFVHLDTGEVRRWGEPSQTRKLVGVLNPTAPVQLTSDRNDYLPDEALFFTWDFQAGVSPQSLQDIHLERFFRGKWLACQAPSSPPTSGSLLPSAFLCQAGSEKLPPYGKYRWIFKLKGSADLLSSNEFYLKKQ